MKVTKEINDTLEKFDKLSSIFGNIKQIKNIYSSLYANIDICEKEKEYNFYGILNSPCLNWKINFLSDVEMMINKLEKYYSKEDIKRGLLNNPFSFKSELDFTYFCVSKNIKVIETEPQLSLGNKLDLYVELNSTKILIEIITPRVKARMIETNYSFFSISGEIEFNLLSEFEKHKIKLNNIYEPFIIVIDPVYAGIGEIEILCSIKEFQRKYPDLSPFLFGIILMKPVRYDVWTLEKTKGYELFKNPSSKFNIDNTKDSEFSSHFM